MNEPSAETRDRRTVTLIDDDQSLAAAIEMALKSIDVRTKIFGSAEEFFAAVHEPPAGCLLIDLAMGGLSGLDLLRTIRKRGWKTPAIILSGTVTVSDAMDAVAYGVLDVLQKPVRARRLQDVVEKALSIEIPSASRGVLRQRVGELTEKEAGVLAYMLEGRMNKSIAFRMDIGLRSVVRHKQSVLDKLGFKEPVELIHEWGRVGMDAPSIGSNDASAALPQRVREEIRLSINDIVTRLSSIACDIAPSSTKIDSVIRDLVGLADSTSLLSPGELKGQPRVCPYVTLLSDSRQESKLLARILRLHQFFPEVCESAEEIIESLSCTETDGMPLSVILNGDESVASLSRIIDSLPDSNRQHSIGILAISSSATPPPKSIDGVLQQHLSYPFDPQDVIAWALDSVNATKSAGR